MPSENATPLHGDYRRYQYLGCRCDACCRGYSEARKLWRAGGSILPQGEWIEAGPVREHVLQLVAAGMSLRMVSDRALVSRSVLQNLVSGRVAAGLAPSKRILTESAHRLLGIAPDPLAVKGKIHPLGVRRRVRALAWLDIPQRQIAAETGLGASTLAHIMSLDDPIEWKTHQLIAHYYGRKQYCRATRGVVHMAAVRAGYAPPWAWDARIDDPTASPDMTIPPPTGAVVDALKRNYASAPDTALVDAGPIRAFVQQALLDRGMTLAAVRIQLRMSDSTLRYFMYGRNGLPPSPSMRAATARLVLRARYDMPTSGRMSLVDATAARRCVQSLMWMGRTQREVAGEAGLTREYVSGISTGAVTHIGYAVHLALERAYLLWQGSLGASIFSRQRAIACQYWPPMVWGAQTIGDPEQAPSLGIQIDELGDITLAQVRFLFWYGSTLDEAVLILRSDRQLVRMQAAALGLVFPDSQIDEREGIEWR